MLAEHVDDGWGRWGERASAGRRSISLCTEHARPAIARGANRCLLACFYSINPNTGEASKSTQTNAGQELSLAESARATAAISLYLLAVRESQPCLLAPVEERSFDYRRVQAIWPAYLPIILACRLMGTP